MSTPAEKDDALTIILSAVYGATIAAVWYWSF